MTKDKNKVIYLKSLFSKFKSNETLSEELKIEMAKLNLNVDAFNNKPIDDAVIPLPRPEITPPVTTIYFIISIRAY